MSGSPMQPDVSVIIPILANVNSLTGLLSGLEAVLTELKVSYEILVVGIPALLLS